MVAMPYRNLALRCLEIVTLLSEPMRRKALGAKGAAPGPRRARRPPGRACPPNLVCRAVQSSAFLKVAAGNGERNVYVFID